MEYGAIYQQFSCILIRSDRSIKFMVITSQDVVCFLASILKLILIDADPLIHIHTCTSLSHHFASHFPPSPHSVTSHVEEKVYPGGLMTVLPTCICTSTPRSSTSLDSISLRFLPTSQCRCRSLRHWTKTAVPSLTTSPGSRIPPRSTASSSH